MASLEDRVRWTERTNKHQNPIDFFRQHYEPNTTRSQLAREDFTLYKILSRKKLLDDAIPNFDHEASKTGRMARLGVSKFGNDPVAYYQEHHAGLTRGELARQDPGLYQRLWKDGLLDNVPIKSSNSR
ncbi:hypothetical protein HYX12_04685 [Candidatus Woesearchaeota archaeon]|nr:hypothetical protein [Candidatus Woesearchaeota archaeon]